MGIPTSGLKVGNHLIKNGKRIQCNTETYVPTVFPDTRAVLSVSLEQTASTTSPQGLVEKKSSKENSKQERSLARRRPLRDPDSESEPDSAQVSPLHDSPCWLREFTDQSVDGQ